MDKVDNEFLPNLNCLYNPFAPFGVDGRNVMGEQNPNEKGVESRE